MNQKIQDAIFEAVYQGAMKAAEEAGDEWVKTHTKPVWAVIQHANPLDDKSPGKIVGQMLDVCGFASVRFVDKRTAFFKWYKRTKKCEYFHIRGKHGMRQEMSLNEDMALAALRFLNNAGITGLDFWSRID